MKSKLTVIIFALSLVLTLAACATPAANSEDNILLPGEVIVIYDGQQEVTVKYDDALGGHVLQVWLDGNFNNQMNGVPDGDNGPILDYGSGLSYKYERTDQGDWYEIVITDPWKIGELPVKSE